MPITTHYLSGFKIHNYDYIQSGVSHKEKQKYCPRKTKENQKRNRKEI